MWKKVEQLIMLTTCVLIMVVAARQGKATPDDTVKSVTENGVHASDTLRVLDDDTKIVSTAPWAEQIKGYAGPTPLEIYVKGDKVEKIVALENNETPSFFERASVLLTQWEGKDVVEASKLQVDVVSGATFTSRALIENMNRGMAFLAKKVAPGVSVPAPDSSAQGEKRTSPDFSLKNLAALLVVLMAMVVPLRWKNRRYRLVQLVLDVAVLGVWCTMFVSYSLILSALTGGLDPLTGYVPLLMLFVAFVYPLFGKKNHYCMHVCPLGAAQELMGRLPVRRLTFGERTVKALTVFRQLVWLVLMALLLTGIYGAWIDYEPFTAFAVSVAQCGVIVFAVLSLVLSLFVPRAYCRFLCPTGTLLKLSQNQK